MRTPSKTLFIFSLLLAVGVPRLRADEALRKAQQALHDQGFYYGSIDGAPGDETTQAVRRYQIRNGLAVTGQLNDETLKSIAKTGAPSTARLQEDRRLAGEPPPPPLAPPPPMINGNDEEPPAPPPRRPARSELRPVPDERPASAPRAVRPSEALMSLFAGTPYEFAPPPVQADLLRRAQLRLMRSGFYGGDANGVPGEATFAALSEFQSANGMRRTGRLNAETLAALRIGPSRPPAPLPGVYEGRVVR